MSMSKLIFAYNKAPTLNAAHRLVSYCNKHPMAVTLLRFEDLEALAAAKRHTATAKDPAKIREAMQTELRARYKNLNITVI
jgi:hypothetical protein